MAPGNELDRGLRTETTSMSHSHVFVARFVSPAIKVAVLSVKAASQHLGNVTSWVASAFKREDDLPGTYSSRRPCPECGGPMFYHPTDWSAFSGRYLRTCESCGYADARPVKIVEQI